jgi:rod shape-determining protein MreC
VSAVVRAYGRRDTVLLVLCVILSVVAQVLPSRVREPIAAALRRTVLAPLVSLQAAAELTRRAWVTREARVAARDSVVLRSMRLDAVAAENDRLRRILGLGAQLRWGFIPAEVLQGRGVGEEYTVTLSAGSRSGVRPFSPVVAPEGLVGMVKTVDPTMSIAIVWAHPDFRVSAMAADGSAFGIVAAHLGSEPERYLLEMRGVPVRSSLKPGTLIVSSGLGSTFPRGIPVGVVLGELRTSELWARTYLLRPAVLPPDVSSVMILLPQRAASGVETVWQLGRGTDSATRAIVTAGDSLARSLRPPANPAAPRSERSVSVSPADSLRARVSGPRRDTAEQTTARRDTFAAPRRDTAGRATARGDTLARPRRDTAVRAVGDTARASRRDTTVSRPDTATHHP